MAKGVPIRERLREYIQDKPGEECMIEDVAKHFGCPTSSVYIPIKELQNEGLVKYIRGKKRFITIVQPGTIYWYQPLFNLMSKEHNKVLLKSEMDDIIMTVQKMLSK